MLKEAYESVVEIAFENAENKEKVKRKKKYVKNKSVSKKTEKNKKISRSLGLKKEYKRIYKCSGFV